MTFPPSFWAADDPGRVNLRSALICFGLALLILLPAEGWRAYRRSVIRSKEAQTKHNLHAIEVALGAYSDEHEDTVPEDLNELLRLGYLKQFPPNAFSGRPMRNLPPGESDNEGDFSYIPCRAIRHYKDGRPDAQCCEYFLLVGYGFRKTRGQRLDGADCAGTVFNLAYPLHLIITLENDFLAYAKFSADYVPPPAPPYTTDSEEIDVAIRRLSAKAAAGPSAVSGSLERP